MRFQQVIIIYAVVIRSHFSFIVCSYSAPSTNNLLWKEWNQKSKMFSIWQGF